MADASGSMRNNSRGRVTRSQTRQGLTFESPSQSHLASPAHYNQYHLESSLDYQSEQRHAQERTPQRYNVESLIRFKSKRIQTSFVEIRSIGVQTSAVKTRSIDVQTSYQSVAPEPQHDGAVHLEVVPPTDSVMGNRRTLIAVLLMSALVLPVAIMLVNNKKENTLQKYVTHSPPKMTSQSLEEASRRLFASVKELEKAFGDINEDTWLPLVSSADWVLSEEEPRHPAAIVVLFPADKTGPKSVQMEKLLESYASMMNDIFGSVLGKDTPPPFQMDAAYFTNLDGRLADLHSQVHRYYQAGGRAVVVRDVDQISTDKELMVFHALCDDFAAPQKRALFIFLVTVPSSIVSRTDQWNHDRSNDIAYKTLDTIWSGVLSGNYRAPLIARVLRESVLVEL